MRGACLRRHPRAAGANSLDDSIFLCKRDACLSQFTRLSKEGIVNERFEREEGDWLLRRFVREGLP